MKKTAQWASQNGVAVEGARNILNNLAQQPEVSEEAKKFIWEKSSSDLQSFRAGQEVGIKQGNKEGFAKGVASTLGVVLAAALGIGGYLYKKNK